LRNSILPLGFQNFKGVDDPLGQACEDALKSKIIPEFDYVLIDESQDLPPSFFQLIYAATQDPKRIIFAYDELQSLTKVSIEDTGALFGFNPDGSKRVDFSKGEYFDGIEMDYVLKRSYRNPYKVLMVAHGIGLGLYNTDGFMQIVDEEKVWNTIGYDVVSGNFSRGQSIVIKRPPEHSVSVVHEVYSGNIEPLVYEVFSDRDEEIDWICKSIQKDVKEEGVEPHDIIVISLNQNSYRTHFIQLQNKLLENGIPSIIPGVGEIERDKFGEKGFLTLSSVFKAKGNEAFIIYVMNFDYLYNYLDFVHARNRAFTSISRTKGWCRLTGVGSKMERAVKEIEDIVRNIPNFKFKFPDPDKIARKLSTEEHARRLEETKSAKNALGKLLTIDEGALETLSQDAIKKLIEKLRKNVDK
jgi:superfamily I DNA and RNA helicase